MTTGILLPTLAVLLAAAGLGGVGAGSVGSSAQQKDEGADPQPISVPRGFELDGASNKLWGQIVAEAAKLEDHPWAGTYYNGDGLGFNFRLAIAPDGGFIWYWRGCMGIYDLNHGPVTTNEQGQLLLKPARQAHADAGPEPAKGYWPVRWGKRRYLVPVGEEMEFANSVNSGEAAYRGQRGFFLVRDDGAEDPVAGLPDAPEPIARLLLKAPLEAGVSEVGKATIEESMFGRLRQTTVRLDRGSAAGVAEGMVLYPPEDELGSGLDEFVVLRVGPDWCEGQLKQVLDLGGQAPPPLPSVGMTFTSRSPLFHALIEDRRTHDATTRPAEEPQH